MSDEEIMMRQRAESLLKHSGIVPDFEDKPVTRKQLIITALVVSILPVVNLLIVFLK